ncbi:AlpA family transcriptional regulator [Sphingobium limneticum]|uniref:AlpA family transcriptional regulator n=2 Tax=Sphingobium limneticum TaxID=1007511 RepID=A0A5J5I852_9SPHN|nr:AlpA family transcriptional regulator [Sphingobium limneticum]KAA9032288.1 AlpA family transcriptional regulator [Sphingobium limneticum]
MDGNVVKLLRMPEVLDRAGISRPTLYRMISAGKFPQPVKIGERATGWINREIDAWVEGRIADRGDA